jgi:hypothetical protein
MVESAVNQSGSGLFLLGDSSLSGSYPRGSILECQMHLEKF